MLLIRRVEQALKNAPEGRLDALERTRTDAKASRSDWHLEVLPQHHQWGLRDRITGTVIPLGVIERFIQDHPADHTCRDCAASC